MIKQLLMNGVMAGCIYALVALGFTLIYRTVKFFHFAHGIVYAVGAYIAYSLIISLDLNPIVSFFLASLLAGVVGILVDRLVYRPLRKRKAPNLVFLIAFIFAYRASR